jgi:hypothetical protein
MSTFGKATGFRGAVTRLLAICTFSTALVAAGAQPVSAFEGCPTTDGPIEGFDYWHTGFPNEPIGSPEYLEQSQAGVTMCYGSSSEDPWETGLAYVQIIDLADGAKIRIHSEKDPEQEVPASDMDWKFNKKRIFDWFDDTFWNPYGGNPDGSLLFSTTNASFFTDTMNPTSELSLPEKSGAFMQSLGVALHGTDPAWNALKRYLKLGPPDSSGAQEIEIGSFPTHYSLTDYETTFDDAYDGLVGFEPLYGGTGYSRRTMLGVAGSKVYILTTDAWFTLAEAQQILQFFHPGMTTIQLDGGGSTSFFSAFTISWVDSYVAREVPDVLGVYFGPEICDIPSWSGRPGCEP